MKLVKVKIEKFKSIDRLEFNLRNYNLGHSIMLFSQKTKQHKKDVFEAMSYLNIKGTRNLDSKMRKWKIDHQRTKISFYFEITNKAAILNTMQKDLQVNMHCIYPCKWVKKEIMIVTTEKSKSKGDQVSFKVNAIAIYKCINTEGNEFVLKKDKHINKLDSFLPDLTILDTLDKYANPKIDISTLLKEIQTNKSALGKLFFIISSSISKQPIKKHLKLAKNANLLPEINKKSSKATDNKNENSRRFFKSFQQSGKPGLFSLVNKSQTISEDTNKESQHKWLNLFLTMLFFSKSDKDSKDHIIFIDQEPLGFKPSNINDFIKIIEEQKAKNRFLIVIATDDPLFIISEEQRAKNILINTNNLKSIIHSNNLMEFKSYPSLILVEGIYDVWVLSEIFRHLKKNYLVLGGSGRKIKDYVHLYRQQLSMILVDDDKIGKKYKRYLNDTGISCYTIRDLCNKIRRQGTLEDAFNINYVQKHLNEAYREIFKKECNLKLASKKPVISTIRNYLNKTITNKEMAENCLRRIKQKIAINIDANTVLDDNPKLYTLVHKIINILENKKPN